MSVLPYSDRWQSITLNEFEARTGTTPTQAAKLLGLAYPRYNELKNGTRQLKRYHIASLEAHMKLSKKALTTLKIERGIIGK